MKMSTYISGDTQYYEHENGSVYARKFDRTGKCNHGEWKLVSIPNSRIKPVGECDDTE
jgi:hypothetical protein